MNDSFGGAKGSTNTITTKFSDLSSYLQILHTRVAVTIAVMALVVATSGANKDLLEGYPSGARPILIYAAAFMFINAVIMAIGALAMPENLPRLIENRLAARNLASVDSVDNQLQDAFIKEIKRRHASLDDVHDLLSLGVVWIFAYVTAVLLLAPSLNPTEQTPAFLAEACVFIGSSIAFPACFLNMFDVAVVILTSSMVFLKIFWRWYKRRRVNASALANETEAVGVAASGNSSLYFPS